VLPGSFSGTVAFCAVNFLTMPMSFHSLFFSAELSAVALKLHWVQAIYFPSSGAHSHFNLVRA